MENWGTYLDNADLAVRGDRRRCLAVPSTAGIGRLRQPAVERPGRPERPRRRFPARTLHVVDIENLAGAAIPSLAQVTEVQGLYLAHLAFGADDQIVMAANHLALLNAALGWPHARYRVRSGPHGADLELLDVLLHENVAARFTNVVIGSGDGLFGQAAASLVSRGVWVTVASRRESLSSGLARAATDVVYLDVPRIAAA